MISAFVLLLCSLSAFISYQTWHILVRRHKSYQDGCEPPTRLPGIDPIFGLDFFFESLRLQRSDRILATINSRFQKYGRTYELRALGSPVIFTIEPENARAVFSTNENHWGVAPLRASAMTFLGRGIITVDGDEWKRARNLVKPNFTKSNVMNFAPIESRLTELFENIQSGQQIDLQSSFLRLYMDFGAEWVFDETFSHADMKVFEADFDNCLSGSGLRLALGPFAFLVPKTNWLKSRDVVRSLANKYIEQALCSISPEKSQTQGRLSFPRYLADKAISRPEAIDQVLNLSIANMATTAIHLSNCLFILSRRPDIWQLLQAEVAALPNFTFDSLRTLKAMRNLLLEALRLYPIFPNLSRVALCDTTLPTGGGPLGTSPIFVPAGTKIVPSQMSMGRDERIWGPDAAQVRLDRWDEGDLERRAWHFMPFGYGTRACLGQQKSNMEVSYILARMVTRFERIESRDAREWVGRMRVTTRNANGCLVALYKKEGVGDAAVADA
ncbi:cytochrome P450 [Pseudovirgaria hyperparasitica]|uniref:Cytochrome P450 n=1 Tax=Pseudovirgaria hyperparasitica TaxID=470096 RepID=A0A6A6W945_9PEZI|nr:cytochrome P450 [Pseudovirgaria hyperparasitica]KAF2759075.1 cytochrome P450 [Pseudovirgaria hyperparasitica]